MKTKDNVGDTGSRCKDADNMDHKWTGCKGFVWLKLAQTRMQCHNSVNIIESHNKKKKSVNFLISWITTNLPNQILHCEINESLQ